LNGRCSRQRLRCDGSRRRLGILGAEAAEDLGLLADSVAGVAMEVDVEDGPRKRARN
jgi:hypothetical protein